MVGVQVYLKSGQVLAGEMEESRAVSVVEKWSSVGRSTPTFFMKLTGSKGTLHRFVEYEQVAAMQYLKINEKSAIEEWLVGDEMDEQ